MNKVTQYSDTEIYQNYLLIGGKLDNGKIWSVEAIGPDAKLSEEDRLRLKSNMRKRRTVGFNLHNFDMCVIQAAIAGRPVNEIKQIANDIIDGGMKPWDIEREYGFDIPRTLDTIDTIEVAPGQASLKTYHCRMHGRRLQDLPYPPDAVLTDEQIEDIYHYWENDLESTEGLFKGLKFHISLREAMSDQYGMDLRSKSDAQLAEAVILKEVSKILGYRPKKPTIPSGYKFKYRAPDFISFQSDYLKDLLRNIEDWTFRLGPSGKVIMPTFLTEAQISIGSSVYSMGIGGLHSTEECASHVVGNGYRLIDRDVEAYYPSLILLMGLFPKQLGKAFLKVFRSIVDRRLKAKAAVGRLKGEIADLEESIKQSNSRSELREEALADLKAQLEVESVYNDGGKIQINGTFGKLGSLYSALFAPDLLMSVTLTGQLALLMLIEELDLNGIDVVSANTDGIVIKPHDSQMDTLSDIIAWWEKRTGLKTEETLYKGVYSASVNNYFAVMEKGGVKRKGHYAKSGLDQKKNPTMDICAEAVAEFLEHGTPISKTIRECKDIRKFVTGRTVNGGAIYGVKEVEFERRGKRGQLLKPGVKFDPSEAEYLGKTVRFYYSTDSRGALHYKDSLNRVPKSSGAKPLMEMTGEWPDDVDIAAYVRDARQMLKDVAAVADLVGSSSKAKRKTEA